MGATLSAEDLDAIAERVADELARREGSRYVDTAGAARRLGVKEDWVRDHAAELGGSRLDGPRGHLRFDVRLLDAAMERRRLARSAVNRPSRRRPGRPRGSGGVDLLPIREDLA